MTINIISESILSSSRSGGVHTAFLTNIKLLQKKNISVRINSPFHADITHIHTIGPYGFYKLLTSKHVIVSTHIMPQTFVKSYKGGKILNFIMYNYLRFFYNHADLVIALNSHVKDLLKEMNITKRIVVIPNSVDIDYFKRDKKIGDELRRRYHIARDAFVVLGVGNLIQRKGVLDFIDLAQELPHLQFVWTGGKQLFDTLSEDIPAKYQKLAEKLPNLTFLGYTPYQEMLGIYSMSDVLLFPSYHEIAPMTIIEAASCGLPIILRDLAEYRFLYGHNYYPCQTNVQFAQVLNKLMDNKKEYQKAQKLSRALAEHFSFAKVGNKLLTMYQEV